MFLSSSFHHIRNHYFWWVCGWSHFTKVSPWWSSFTKVQRTWRRRNHKVSVYSWLFFLFPPIFLILIYISLLFSPSLFYPFHKKYNLHFSISLPSTFFHHPSFIHRPSYFFFLPLLPPEIGVLKPFEFLEMSLSVMWNPLTLLVPKRILEALTLSKEKNLEKYEVSLSIPSGVSE